MSRDGTNALPWIKGAFLLVLLGTLSFLVLRELPAEWFAPARIRAFLAGLGFLAPLAYIVIRAVGIVMSVIPNAPLDIAGGVAFGPFWGTVYALIGSELGAVACFILARILGREAISRLLHRRIVFGDRVAQRQMAYIVFFARLEPVFSFALVSYGAGLTRMSLRAFAVSTLLGMTPGTILLNYYGMNLFSRVNPLLQAGLGLVLVILLFAVPFWIKRKNPWGLYDKMIGNG